MLKPLITSTREVVSLDGVWNFALAKTHVLEDDPAWTRRIPPRLQVPVPASYNDIFVDKSIRDHVGWVFYQRTVTVPKSWEGQRCYLRFGAATHRARVYFDDQFVVEHVGGYTPFEADITKLISVSATREFRLTVAVSNELNWDTIPPGKIETLADGSRKQVYQHDFFNYSGLARSVSLCAVPLIHVNDITVTTDLQEDGVGIVTYSVETSAPVESSRCNVSLIDEEGTLVFTGRGLDGHVTVENANAWQPDGAYLYQLRVELFGKDSPETLEDVYELSIGIRSVKVQGNKFLINGKPFYFKGFGKHEDSPIRGKGFDPAYMIHDFSLMGWCNANSFRTSHYPYAEEFLDYADRHGIVVIDETAAVGLHLGIVAGVFGLKSPPTFSPETCNDATREAHADAIKKLISRDKNHPSVVMWALTNEPASNEAGVREYMEPLVSLARGLDSRPLCFTNMGFATFENDLITDLFDVVCLNRYYGWYTQMGDLAAAEKALEKDLLGWERVHKKPIIMTEYGADCQVGLHAVCDVAWSEEYQASLLEMFHRVFDRVDSVVGEHVWSFADFQCTSTITRVDGNKKGIFTRDRRPKGSAQILKRRWKDGPEKMPKA
ncbi:glycoside hydrolase superfamily [Plectosphaerella plurivora]|uniref:Beta-glucuronidase n=1 Tax=Plectosphaerella plurivora TaxID=936078 RepID=A0A9P8V2F8_9PEZI|nr:glycoside hydrolase superfamily [Plectosphaerella plurivora]